MHDIEQEMTTQSCFLSCWDALVKLYGVDNVVDQHRILGVDTMPVLVGIGTDVATVIKWLIID